MGKQKKSNGSSSHKKNSAGSSSGENARFIAGLVLLVFALYMLVVFISYVLTGKADQDSLSLQPDEDSFAYKNWGGKFGFKIGHYFIFSGFGLGSFFIPLIIGAFGLALLKVKYFRLWKNVLRFLLATVIISVILGYFAGQSTFIGAGPGGEFGYMIAHRLNEMMGKVGTGAVLLVITVAYLIFALHVSPQTIRKPIATVARAGASVLSGEGRKKDIVTDDVTLHRKITSLQLMRNRSGQMRRRRMISDDFYKPPT